MSRKTESASRGLCVGTVLSNGPIRACFWKITLKLDSDGAGFFSKAVPGQFAEFDLSSASLPPAASIEPQLRDCACKQILLRRPFSFSDISVNHSSEGTCVKIEVIYCVLGPATVRMTSLKKGDQISILGPLGNGFSIPEGMDHAVLVTGGMGAPPILHLAHFLKQHFSSVQITAFAGAKTFESLPFELQIDNKTGTVIEDFQRLGIHVHIATDDGSAGSKGFITQTLRLWLEKNAPNPDRTVIYACGPEAMLAACAVIAAQKNIPCQVSMERMMACGIGLCQSCAVKMQTKEPDQPLYKLCCREGPVFDSRTVLFKSSQS